MTRHSVARRITPQIEQAGPPFAPNATHRHFFTDSSPNLNSPALLAAGAPSLKAALSGGLLIRAIANFIQHKNFDY